MKIQEPAQPNPKDVLQKPKSKKRYLIAAKRGSIALQSGLQPMNAADLRTFVNNIPNATILNTIRTGGEFSPQSVTSDEAREVHLVELSAEDYATLSNTKPEHIHIEEEQHLDYLDSLQLNTQIPPRRFSLASFAIQQEIDILVLGEDEQPIEAAEIQLTTSTGSYSGTSDKEGRATINISMLPGTTIETLFAKAKTMYWDLYIQNPDLTTDSVNVLRLQSLIETIPEFPNKFRYGWGEIMMGLPDQESRLSGRGIKIAIIDSGMGDHELLSHVTRGYNVTGSGEITAWNTDTIGHGTHVAGVIGANGENGKMKGFCPGAEIIVIKVFPGGTTSALVEALKVCIEEGVDVANLSLGTPNSSLIIEQHIEEAMLSGVAFIVAAGNDGGPVQFPANSPNTLAVSAIGTTTEVRENTWDHSQIAPELTAPNGLFSPRFTSFGAQVDVSGPGVSIISTGPDNTYFPDSGTSMAAPHITGLAGLLLAHHPAFATIYKNRNSSRVAALYSLLRQISYPINFGTGRTGHGLPNLQSVAKFLHGDSEAQANTLGATPLPVYPNNWAGVLPYYYQPGS